MAVTRPADSAARRRPRREPTISGRWRRTERRRRTTWTQEAIRAKPESDGEHREHHRADVHTRRPLADSRVPNPGQPRGVVREEKPGRKTDHTHYARHAS